MPSLLLTNMWRHCRRVRRSSRSCSHTQRGQVFQSVCTIFMCFVQLGCGTALPGIVAAKLGAKVTLSDSEDFPLCHQQAKQSCMANKLNDVEVIGITWGLYNPALLNLTPVDIVLGSDCFYDTTGNCL